MSMHLNRCVVAAMLAGLSLSGCADSGPARAPIQGLVTIGGQPLAAGRILFTPAAPNEGPAASARIVDGKYALTDDDGPVPGQNRVQIEADLALGFAIDDEQAFALRAARPLPAGPIPPEFGNRSQVVVEVKPGDANHYDVTIPQARHVAARPPY
jgi:hypothetical protein